VTAHEVLAVELAVVAVVQAVFGGYLLAFVWQLTGRDPTTGRRRRFRRRVVRVLLGFEGTLALSLALCIAPVFGILSYSVLYGDSSVAVWEVVFVTQATIWPLLSLVFWARNRTILLRRRRMETL
jgi:hypothetical protein